MKLRKILITTISLLTFLLSGCSFETYPVASVNIIKETTSLSVGEEETLEYTITPNNATNKNVTWSILDTSVASISSSGLVKGISEGETTAKITTKDGEFTDTCAITITTASIPVTGLSLDKTSLDLHVYEQAQLTATIAPSNATNKGVTWSSNVTSVASVNNGLVSALSVGNCIITAKSVNGGFTATCEVSVTASSESLKTLSLTTSNFSFSTTYDENSGVTSSIGGYSYGYHRLSSGDSSTLGVLVHQAYNYAYSELSGAIYNQDPISGIRAIELTYKSTGGVAINYGLTKSRGETITLASSGSTWQSEKAICLGSNNYFSIEAVEADVSIKSVTISYTDSITTNLTTSQVVSSRLAPTVCPTALVDGETTIEVPNVITIKDGHYSVVSSKTYTYYSFTYCQNNTSVISQAAMTDPVDVANYYIAFGEIPANYGGSAEGDCGTVSQVKSLFGSDARKISAYSRTSGYANSVSWSAHGSDSTPYYYEFDIDITDSYTTSSRGAGRLVMWVDGWSCYSDETPVAVYTDDHYTTFSEYLNYGSFGPSFDSQPESYGYRTGCTNLLGSSELSA